MQFWTRIEPALLRGLATPVPPVRAGVSLLAASGRAGCASSGGWRCSRCEPSPKSASSGEGASLLIAGNALHADLTPDSALGGFFGLFLAALGQRHGFPFPAGGAGEITAALARRAEARGVDDRHGTPVERVLVRKGRAVGVEPEAATSLARDVLAAVSIWELNRLLGRPTPAVVEPDPAVVEGRLDARRRRPVAAE